MAQTSGDKHIPRNTIIDIILLPPLRVHNNIILIIMLSTRIILLSLSYCGVPGPVRASTAMCFQLRTSTIIEIPVTVTVTSFTALRIFLRITTINAY